MVGARGKAGSVEAARGEREEGKGRRDGHGEEAEAEEGEEG